MTARDNDSDLVFESPPKTATAGTYGAVALQLTPLKERPGEWARAFGPANRNHAAVWASRVRTGRRQGIARGDYEAALGQLDESSDEWFVWVRYIGAGAS